MMRPNAGFHTDQARWEVGQSRLDLTARPLLPQHDRTTLVMADDVERVLADIDADNGDHAVLILGHGVLHRMAAPRQRAPLVGQEHGRTIPLSDI